MMTNDIYVQSFSIVTSNVKEKKYFEICMTLHQMTHFRCITGNKNMKS